MYHAHTPERHALQEHLHFNNRNIGVLASLEQALVAPLANYARSQLVASSGESARGRKMETENVLSMHVE